MRFVDTNVLLYAVSRNQDGRHKAELARNLLDERDLGLSVQVLAEFCVQATRPGRPDALDHAQGARLVESFTRFSVRPMTTAIVLAALATRGGVSAHSPFLGD